MKDIEEKRTQVAAMHAMMSAQKIATVENNKYLNLYTKSKPIVHWMVYL